MRIRIAIVLAASSVAAFAQSPDRAEVFSSTQLKSQLIELAEQAKTKGSSGAKLGEYGSHSIMLSERTANGGAEVHAHFDDVMLVIEGKATLITGGELIDAHSGPNGESGGFCAKAHRIFSNCRAYRERASQRRIRSQLFQRPRDRNAHQTHRGHLR